MNAPDTKSLLKRWREIDRQERQRQERALRNTINDILDDRDSGGVANLLTDIADILREREGNYLIAADHIDACSELCDLRYRED